MVGVHATSHSSSPWSASCSSLTLHYMKHASDLIDRDIAACLRQVPIVLQHCHTALLLLRLLLRLLTFFLTRSSLCAYTSTHLDIHHTAFHDFSAPAPRGADLTASHVNHLSVCRSPPRLYRIDHPLGIHEGSNNFFFPLSCG